MRLLLRVKHWPSEMSQSGTGDIEIWRMNAFTDTPFQGNPAGVVLDGDGLTDTQKQLIAPQLNSISETVYLGSPNDPEADIRLQFYTSTCEVDLCGHATIAAMFALAHSGRIAGASGVREVRAETRVGVLHLTLEFVAGKLSLVTMIQPFPEFCELPGRAQVADVLGLEQAAIRTDIPVGCATTGIWSAYVPLVGLQALAAVHVDFSLIESLWPDNPEFAGIYPFVLLGRSGDKQSMQSQGRFFCPPKFGIAEDPITGTASGALAAYLIHHGLMDETDQLEVRQGVEMGSEGRLIARQTGTGAIAICGQAVPIYRGRLTL